MLRKCSTQTFLYLLITYLSPPVLSHNALRVGPDRRPRAWLPDGYSQFFRSYVLGPLGLEGPWLRYATLQNLIPCFSWIKFCHLATLDTGTELGYGAADSVRPEL